MAKLIILVYSIFSESLAGKLTVPNMVQWFGIENINYPC